ncbi:MAG TPA: hypothetical protein VGC72_00985 [Candidatus Elarobacter sp.]|jgi:hypothetical protein
MTEAQHIPTAIPLSAQADLTIAHAARVLGRDRKVLDNLIRREHVIPVEGKRGKGGEYRVLVKDLPALSAAVRLLELKVPKGALKRLVSLLRRHVLPDGGDVAIVYTPEREEVVTLKDRSELYDIVGQGATVDVINVAQLRTNIQQRLHSEEMPRRRGRPAMDRAWMQKKLSESRDLGDDETPVDELARWTGERGELPWTRAK